MKKNKIILITGTRKGIGRSLAQHFIKQGALVIGCSRGEAAIKNSNYKHFALSITDENKVSQLFNYIRNKHHRLDVLINNAGIAAMNHSLMTPFTTAKKILETNTAGTFLFCREAAKIMRKNSYGRVVNFTSVAVPLKLEGEAVYAASKAAVISLTEILAKELADFGITINAVGPSPVDTDLIRSIPSKKIKILLSKQAIHQMSSIQDVIRVIDFYLDPKNSLITGQVIFLGGV